MSEKITGSCLCEKVRYQVVKDFSAFHQCHCNECQKITGSAHASNIFVKPELFEWLAGEEWIKTYDHEPLQNRKVFCSECGSGLPFESRRMPMMIIPAGSLDDEPGFAPKSHIFWDDHAKWYVDGLNQPQFEAFPPAKK